MKWLLLACLIGTPDCVVRKGFDDATACTAEWMDFREDLKQFDLRCAHRDLVQPHPRRPGVVIYLGII